MTYVNTFSRQINSSPNDKILYFFKLKSFADAKINVIEKMKFVLGRVKNMVGKRGNAVYQYFLVFPPCFQKSSYQRKKSGWFGKGLNPLFHRALPIVMLQKIKKQTISVNRCIIYKTQITPINILPESQLRAQQSKEIQVWEVWEVWGEILPLWVSLVWFSLERAVVILDC